ncbi:MAG: SGNH/GDSL hydrolase family protein [Chthoniobacterales bacterium]
MAIVSVGNAWPQLAPDKLDGDRPEVAMPDPELTANTFEAGSKSAGPSDRETIRHPAIRSGLEVTSSGGGIKVASGSAEMEGGMVEAKGKTLAMNPPDPLNVRGQAIKLFKAPFDEWKSRTLLAGQPLGMRKVMPGSLIAKSVEITTSDGRKLVRGQDFVIDPAWNAVALAADSGLTEGPGYTVDYQLGPRRVDSVNLSEDGEITLQVGESELASPPLPEPEGGKETTLARIYWPGGDVQTVEPANIFPVGSFLPDAGTKIPTERFNKFRAKVESGEPITIVCWGDSVTVGGDADPMEEMRYSAVFERALQERYPNARVETIAKGASTSAMWFNPNHDLSKRWKDIEAAKPDLVTLEFVNDSYLTKWPQFKNQYDRILQKVNAMGAELLLITPHFTMMEKMGHQDLRGAESRPYVTHLRRFADENNVALADASKRWEQLWRQGIPYEIYLKNGINHPDNRGHKIFADALMEWFPEHGESQD